jgi:O-methyltransferase involved in polyketide biosynthesis
VADFDASRPSIARVYDYILGGKDNFAADRLLAERLTEIGPAIPDAVRENRAMVARAVRWAAEQGVGQFIDLGCGLPTDPNTHQTSRGVVPDARTAYIDDDPVVIAHLNALLRRDPGVAVISADVGEVDKILGAVTKVIDLSQPACLVMGALLHFYGADAARALVSAYTAALAPGSYVVFSVFEAAPGPDTDQMVKMYSAGPHSVSVHPVADLESFCVGLELLPPGVADARTWRPDWETVPVPAARGVWIYGAMARVP